MKTFVFIIFFILATALFGRNYTELQEWREKKLPIDIKKGVQVEIYDFESRQGVKYKYPAINIRIHNRGSSAVEDLVITLWFWKNEGVYVKELVLLGEEGGYGKKLFSGEERYMPSERRYYNFKDIRFEEIKRIEMKITRMKSR
ncbi:hypothetical protein [uncultured Ilyobacter sp.]|uniref:hypothetical protein n=1 Tax=uncultured Ilyobacter sp. TaxID=544433 RepID=UPI0029F4C0E1|nr:hypothetical protein [uncultured Ilyobacter sp.]